MAKILIVSSAVQAALMREILIPEMLHGFWSGYRPAGHGEVWRDVEVVVSEDGDLGPRGFDAPRNYNYLNLDFAVPNETRLVSVAQSVKANSNFKSVKKELIELGQIVGGRLANRDAERVKLYRGNHQPGTVTVSTAKARAAAAQLGEAGAKTLTTIVTPSVPKPEGAKRTVVKAKPADQGVEISKSAAGATVRRVPVQTAEAPSTLN